MSTTFRINAKASFRVLDRLLPANNRHAVSRTKPYAMMGIPSLAQRQQKMFQSTTTTASQPPGSASTISSTSTTSPSTPPKRPMTVNSELPDPLAENRKVKYQFALFSVLVTVAFVAIVNYEKLSSPIIGSTMHVLRRSQKVKELLGNQVDFDSIFPWIKGELNQMKGKINISFYIKGSNGKIGKVILVADRPNRSVPLTIYEWSVTVDDVKHDIMSDDSVDFLS